MRLPHAIAEPDAVQRDFLFASLLLAFSMAFTAASSLAAWAMNLSPDLWYTKSAA